MSSNERKAKIDVIPVIGFVFNKWKSVARNWKSIDWYQRCIVTFCVLWWRGDRKKKANPKFQLFFLFWHCEWKASYIDDIAAVLLWIILFGTLHFQLQFSLKSFTRTKLIGNSATTGRISIPCCWRLIIVWMLTKKNYFHIVVIHWIVPTASSIKSMCWL